MKLVYMGTPDFAVNTLEALIAAGHEISLVVTQPDKTKGRGKKLVYSPVKECAIANNLTVAQPEKARDPEFVEEIKAINPDAIVVVAFGQILPESILEIPKYGCINVHASLLPAYRGAAPIQWAVIDGLKETGVTTMYMDKGLDTGDIIDQKVISINADETGGSLFDRLACLGGEIIVETLDKIERGVAARTKQDDSKSNYAKMLSKDMGRIDFSKDADELERLIRGLNPWPSAFTTLEDKLLKIYQAEVISEETALDMASKAGVEGSCGQVIALDKKSFTIRCGNGALRVINLQLEGKKRMDTAAFLLGYKIETGLWFK
ncbi:MAG: methionyl-tRNA formyltransferase [Lachnospiraceae bacterium]|nr:methionyl-tRNA formyltransferase [Lachnospiraceae bacterium]